MRFAKELQQPLQTRGVSESNTSFPIEAFADMPPLSRHTTCMLMLHAWTSDDLANVQEGMLSRSVLTIFHLRPVNPTTQEYKVASKSAHDANMAYSQYSSVKEVLLTRGPGGLEATYYDILMMLVNKYKLSQLFTLKDSLPRSAFIVTWLELVHWFLQLTRKTIFAQRSELLPHFGHVALLQPQTILAAYAQAAILNMALDSKHKNEQRRENMKVAADTASRAVMAFKSLFNNTIPS
jgi:hypothetical protein